MRTDNLMYGTDPLKQTPTSLAEMGVGEMDWLGQARSIVWKLTPTQHLEIKDKAAFGAVILSARSRGLLRALQQDTSIDRGDIEGLLKGYDDLRAFAHVLSAGLASDSDQGITITSMGRFVADSLFGERTVQDPANV